MNEKLMRRIGFDVEVDRVNHIQCPICSKRIVDREFRDKLSRKEFNISGLCQDCQDEVFQDKPIKEKY